jgi:hypothetical protein
MQITVGYRYYIIYYGDVETAGAAVTAFICDNPGYCMCTYFKAVDHKVVTEGYNDATG